MKKAILVSLAALAFIPAMANANWFAEVSYGVGTNQVMQSDGYFYRDGSATMASYKGGYIWEAGAGFVWQIYGQHVSDVQVQDLGYNTFNFSLRKVWGE